MKLTDEQISEIRKEFRTIPVDGEGHAIPIEYDEHYVRATVLKLLADRQAWKEDAESFKRLFEGEMDLRHHWMNEAYENKDQLNQAVEVLKWYAKGENYTSNHNHHTGHGELSLVEIDGGERARTFLATEQQVKRKCMACNGSRYYDSHGSPPCGACDGTGYEEGE